MVYVFTSWAPKASIWWKVCSVPSKRDPSQPKRPRGRPEFVPTVTMRRTVEEMAGDNKSQDVIARALGIKDDTLRKYFPTELANGAAKKHKEALALMWKFAKKGSATLINKLVERTQAAASVASFDKPESDLPSTRKPVVAVKRGKKEIARENAINAGLNSEWGEDLAPLPGTKPTVN